MAIKIDLEKAYDRLQWSFINEVLKELNLLMALQSILMDCISSSSLDILWNGARTREFNPT